MGATPGVLAHSIVQNAIVLGGNIVM